MKILFGLWHMTGYAGTQSWSYTLAQKLRGMGHDVSFYTGQVGMMACRVMNEGFRVYSFLREKPPEVDLSVISQPRMFLVCPECGYGPVYETEDFTIQPHRHRVNGKKCVSGVQPRNALPEGKRLYVLHGWLPHDRPLLDGTDYVCISEETRDSLKNAFKIDAKTILRQPVDLKRFYPRRWGRTASKTVHFLSTHPADEYKMAAIVEKMGLEVYERPTGGQAWDVVRHINDSDIVIGTGRGVAEAMACGRHAIVCGKFGLDGLVTPKNLDDIERYNYSGRATCGEIEALEVDLENAKKPDIALNRFMAARFKARPIAEKLLEVGAA